MEVSFVFFGCLALALVAQGQDQSGFISIDCGIAEGSEYEDKTTSISYTSDVQYIETGISGNISSDFMSDTLMRQLLSVRSFPQGINNCYTFKPAQARGNNYLIRAIFMYGDYDSKAKPPEFALYLEEGDWDVVKFGNASDVVIKEIIHVPVTDYIHVCLVNTGSGTPFISALELRHLNNTIYKTQSGSLALQMRLDVGSTTTQMVRYNDDVYDRIWKPYSQSNWDSMTASYNSGLLSTNDFKPPSSVMMTAARPPNGSNSLDFVYRPADSRQKFYLYLHFAGLEEIETNQLRIFQISLNGESWHGPVLLRHMLPYTVYSTQSLSGTQLRFSITVTDNSTLPPILNAMEIYMVKDFSQSPTHQNDVDAIREVKSVYGVKRNWQGDPCAPTIYSWNGLECIYNDYNSSRIISLNLSSSALSGNIDPSISHLKLLKYLDLSNNSLTGSVPDFLSQLPLLETLNLWGNKLSGSVPSALIEKSNNGNLTLRLDGNPNLCKTGSCKKKKKNVILPVIASVATSCLVVLTALAVLRSFRKGRKQALELVEKQNKDDETLDRRSRQFTYSEVVSITGNFQKVLGKGGFGTVYNGYLEDGTQVAVKMLSPSSTQGSKQFRAEAQLLTKVHHRNLVILIGYCNEGQEMGLIYEFMTGGNLQEHLSERNTALLSWEQRLGIAVDAAQALEYLHNGCKPPIVHRDIKTSNILLNEKLQAKVSDFGLSRFMPLDSGNYVSTTVVGTPGYLDPEYYVSNRLNEKSDVYSFGIILLELITGQPAVVKTHDNTNIAQWVQPMIERGEIRDIIDSRLQGNFNINSVWKAVETAMACLPHSSIQRPTMSQVLVELKECLDIEISHDRNWKIKDYRSASNNSIAVDPDSSMGPYAR